MTSVTENDRLVAALYGDKTICDRLEDPLSSKNEISNKDPWTQRSRIKSSLQNFKFKVKWLRSLLVFRSFEVAL